MIRVLQFVLVGFQRFPTSSGNSTRHERDIEGAATAERRPLRQPNGTIEHIVTHVTSPQLPLGHAWISKNKKSWERYDGVTAVVRSARAILAGSNNHVRD